MEDIIKPIDRELLKKELTIDKYIRKTNYNKNEIYNLMNVGIYLHN